MPGERHQKDIRTHKSLPKMKKTKRLKAVHITKYRQLKTGKHEY